MCCLHLAEFCFVERVTSHPSGDCESEERKDMKCLEESSLVPIGRLVLISKTGWNSVILNVWLLCMYLLSSLP